MIIKIAICLATVSLLIGCAAQTNIQPVGKGEIHAHASFGGPIIKAFGIRIPLPYSTAGVSYGLSDQINTTCNVHLFPLAYELAGCDLGANWFPVSASGMKPTVGLQPQAMFLMSLKSDVPSRIRIYPFVTATASWPDGTNQLFIGSDLTVPITEPDYDADSDGRACVFGDVAGVVSKSAVKFID